MPIPIADRLTRYEMWVHREPVDRPLIGLLWEPDIRGLPQFLDAIDQTAPLTPDQIDPQIFLPHIEAAFERCELLHMDVIQSFGPGFSIPWIEGYVGCPVVRGGDTLWVDPFLQSYDDRAPITIDWDNPWLRKFLEFVEALVDLSDGRFPVVHPPLHRPLYALAQMRGQEQLCFDLADNPDGVKRILSELNNLWIQIVDACLCIIPPFHGGYSTWLKAWMPGTAITLQNEFGTLISPDMHAEFVHPLDQAAVNRFPNGQVYHTHGSAHHQIDDLLSVDGLVAMQLDVEQHMGGPPLDIMLSAAAKILEAKPLVLTVPDTETADICIEHLPSTGLYLNVLVIPRKLGYEYDDWLEARCQ